MTSRFALLAGLGLCASLGLVLAQGTSPPGHEHHSGPSGPQEQGGYTQMGPHMKVTSKRQTRPGDLERANRIVEETRRTIAPFKDHRVALREGYKPFLAQLPLPEYHFTNYWYGAEAAFRFNIEHPTSLLYVREREAYRLTGVMFTAPARASLEELDSRVPLSVAQWHLHVNLCQPPPGRGWEALRPNARFGLRGSISTEEECEKAGGRFSPRVFGWMVHVYPYEERLEDIFRMPGHHDHGGEHVH